MSVDFFLLDGPVTVPVEFGAWWTAYQRYNRLFQRYSKAEHFDFMMRTGTTHAVVGGIHCTDYRRLTPDEQAEVAGKICSPEWRCALELAAIKAGAKAAHLEKVARDAWDAAWQSRLNRAER